MKEKIYTIPVTDALRENGECPFCSLRRGLEASALEFITGPSYMERDTRAETDRKGFCSRHSDIILGSGNALGAALMLQTRLLAVSKDFDKIVNNAPNPKKLMKKGDNPYVSAALGDITGTCYVCDRINDTFGRYVETFFYLYETEQEIRALVRGGNGFCLPHFGLLIEQSVRELSKKTQDEFKNAVVAAQQAALRRLQGELEQFVRRFDYRFKDEPIGEAKDSPRRAALKLSGGG